MGLFVLIDKKNGLMHAASQLSSCSTFIEDTQENKRKDAFTKSVHCIVLKLGKVYYSKAGKFRQVPSTL